MPKNLIASKKVDLGTATSAHGGASAEQGAATLQTKAHEKIANKQHGNLDDTRNMNMYMPRSLETNSNNNNNN